MNPSTGVREREREADSSGQTVPNPNRVYEHAYRNLGLGGKTISLKQVLQPMGSLEVYKRGCRVMWRTWLGSHRSPVLVPRRSALWREKDSTEGRQRQTDTN